MYPMIKLVLLALHQSQSEARMILGELCMAGMDKEADRLLHNIELRAVARGLCLDASARRISRARACANFPVQPRVQGPLFRPGREK